MLCWWIYSGRSGSWCVPVSGSWGCFETCDAASMGGSRWYEQTILSFSPLVSSHWSRPSFRLTSASVKVPKLCHSIFECRLPSLIWCPSASGAERWCPPQLQLSFNGGSLPLLWPTDTFKSSAYLCGSMFLTIESCLHSSLALLVLSTSKKQNKRQDVWQLSIICCLFRQSWLMWICKYL